MPRRLTAAAILAAVAIAGALPSHAAGVRDRAEAWDPPPIVPLAAGEVLPTPQELESRSARIGEILVHVHDVFDPDDPREDN